MAGMWFDTADWCRSEFQVVSAEHAESEHTLSNAQQRCSQLLQKAQEAEQLLDQKRKEVKQSQDKLRSYGQHVQDLRCVLHFQQQWALCLSHVSYTSMASSKQQELLRRRMAVMELIAETKAESLNANVSFEKKLAELKDKHQAVRQAVQEQQRALQTSKDANATVQVVVGGGCGGGARGNIDRDVMH